MGKIEKVEILQEEEKQLLDYVLLHTASSSSSSCSFLDHLQIAAWGVMQFSSRIR